MTDRGPPPLPSGFPIVDLHSHVIPGVDDGAVDAEEGVEGLRALVAQGAVTVVATPHLDASVCELPEVLARRLERLDAGLASLDARLAEATELTVRVERGAEVRLDAPEPDLSDPRVRVAGTDWVLVEFTAFQIPPYAERQLAAIQDAGRRPLLAHPERYLGAPEAVERMGDWRDRGVRLQVNAGSLVGQYGAAARHVARALLERGWVDVLASDFHSRGTPRLAGAMEALGSLPGGQAALERLLAENPARILEDQETLPVEPLKAPSGFWEGVRDLLR